MEATLQDFLTTGIFAFILTFVRVGTAVMIMPGLGDSFVPERIRLLVAVSLAFVLFPFTAQYIPAGVPSTFELITLISSELVIGLFFGTVARIFMMVMDVAGLIISISSGLSNAQVFNPTLATQGSLVGAFLSVTGVVVLFATDLHHLLIKGVLDTYLLFPVGDIPDYGSMAEFMSRTVAASFSIGVKIGSPFIVLTLLVYIGMGVMARVMPQVQVFLLALPLQVLVSLVLLAFVVFGIFTYWIGEFEEGMIFLLSPPQ